MARRPGHTTKQSFANGTENPMGLGLQPFIEDDGRVTSAWTPRPEYRSYTKITHGGLYAVALDDVVGMAVGTATTTVVATMQILVDFKVPVYIGETVTVEGWYTGEDGKDLTGEGRIVKADGTIAATGKLRFRVIPKEKMAAFMGRIPEGAERVAREKEAAKKDGG